jgi:O-antigen/teichoic acid export membrane protein
LSLKPATFSAVRWTTVGMIVTSGFRFFQMVLLARLLSPSDFGLMAVVIAVIAFTQVFSDMGVSSAIIHRQQVSRIQLATLYWLNIGVGAFLTIVLIVFSKGISHVLFNEPALQPVLVLSSFSILIAAIGQQFRVLFEKTLEFRILAKIEIVAAASAFAVAVIWAWRTPSVYALAVAILTNQFVKTLFFCLLGSCRWRPAFRFNLKKVGAFLKFGAYKMANNLINSINTQIDILMAGRVFPAATVGSYSLPRNLSLIIGNVLNPVVTRVGLPVMASAQADKEFLKVVYLKTMRMTASVNFPIYLVLAVFSEDIVLLAFGPQWVAAGPLLIYLAIWGMLRSVGNPVGSLLLAVGRADLSFKWNLSLLFIVPLGLWIGASWGGIHGLVVAQAGVATGLLIPSWFFLVRPLCGATAVEYLTNLWAPLAPACLAIAVAYGAVTGIDSAFLRVATGGGIAAVGYSVLSLLFNYSWVNSMRELLSPARWRP